MTAYTLYGHQSTSQGQHDTQDRQIERDALSFFYSFNFSIEIRESGTHVIIVPVLDKASGPRRHFIYAWEQCWEQCRAVGNKDHGDIVISCEEDQRYSQHRLLQLKKSCRYCDARMPWAGSTFPSSRCSSLPLAWVGRRSPIFNLSNRLSLTQTIQRWTQISTHPT